MRVVMYTGGGHQTEWINAGATGFRRHGIQPFIVNHSKPIGCDIAVLWGVRRKQIIEFQKSKGNDILVFERGYFNDRLRYTSVGFNGLNRDAEFYNANSPSDRWKKHGVHVLPWQPGEAGDRIVIGGQVQGDMSCEGLMLKNFYTDLAGKVKTISDVPLFFKPHPAARCDSSPTGIPLTGTLENAKWVIAYNSNLLVDAVLSGIPCIALQQKTMAWDVCHHAIEALKSPPIFFNRTQWLYDLAYTQWTLLEIKNGVMWAHLKDHHYGNPS